MAESVNQRRCDCCGVPNGGHALGCLDYWPPQEPPSPQPFHGTLGEEVPLAFLARFITSPSTLELWQYPQRPYALLLYHRGFSATQVHPNGAQMAEHDILVPLLPADIRRLRDLCDRVLRALPASPAALRTCEAKVWYGDAVLQAESGTDRVRGDQES